jgi:hypothetical protein
MFVAKLARMRTRLGLGVAVALFVGAGACGSVTLMPDGGGAGSGGGADGGAGTTGTGGTAGGTGGGAGGAAGAGGHAGTGGSGGHAGGSGGSGGVTCQGLTEVQCRATTGCSVGVCGACSGGSSFSGCYATGATPPPCPGYACPVGCQGLAEAACLARQDCRTDYCPGCQQGKIFSRCTTPDAPPPSCPAAACPVTCDAVTTLDGCEARTDCHSVFVDPGTCGCAAVGCCAHFSRCVAGDKAKCTPPTLLCRVATPFCEGTFVVAYTDSCFEGCVQKKDCAP